jgi:hypothetical protein
MRRLYLAVIILVCCSFSAYGQQKAGGPEKYVEVPRENALVLVAQQPECPLRIENAAFLVKADATDNIIRHTIRNISSKPVRRFTVLAYNSYATGGTLGNRTLDSDMLLMPGETLEVGESGKTYELVPMNDKVRDALKPEKGAGMRAFWVLMVDRVVFADGTVYEDKKAAQEFIKLLESMSQ